MAFSRSRTVPSSLELLSATIFHIHTHSVDFLNDYVNYPIQFADDISVIIVTVISNPFILTTGKMRAILESGKS